MKVTPTIIAKTISDILGCKYSHHDLHYSNNGCLSKEYSLLTSYPGMCPYTFSILENGKIETLTSFTMNILFSEVFSDMIDDLLKKDEYKGVKEEREKILKAEKWISDNNVIQILKDNLSPFYKDLLNRNEKSS